MNKTALLTLLTLSSAQAVADVYGAGTTPSAHEMWEIIKRQKTEIDLLKTQQTEAEKKLESAVDALENGSSTASWADKTFIGGYGEHHFNNTQNGPDMVDAHRFVIFINHEYNDTVKFFSEFELEHSLAGEGKPGEVELEQAYIEWQYGENHYLKAGLFLIPVGILNETHEPDTFYGVERNNVEKNIIPTTWWETGAMLSGNFGEGFSYDFAVHSGLETSPQSSVRSGRQKSANATAEKLAYTGRLKYTGIQGLELSASAQWQEDMSQGASADIESGVLLETHLIYTTGEFSLRALYTSWQIEGEQYEANGKDRQFGYYFEPAYKITSDLGMFVRYSVWNNASNSQTSKDSKTIDVGLNYWLHPRVVLKADYQSGQSNNVDDIANIGIGWSF